MTAAAALVAIGPLLPGASYVLGRVTASESSRVGALTWSVFELATLAFHFLGPKRALSLVLSRLDALCRYAAIVALIYLSGSAASPLWVIAMIQSFAWTAKPPRRASLDVVTVVASHTSLAVAFLVDRRAGDAWLTLLVLLASVIGYTMTSRTVARSARVRAERDVVERQLREATLRQDRERMARDLHDGVGADVTALVLRLQRAADEGTHPKAVQLASKARNLLDELRGVIWSLRNEQGRLAELGKLIDATCRGVRGDIAYERVTPLTMARERVGPRAALTTLSMARELVRNASRTGVSKLTLKLAVTSELEVTVDGDGPALSPEARDDILTALDDARRAFDEVRGIDVSSLPDGAGVQMRVTIALDPVQRAA